MTTTPDSTPAEQSKRTRRAEPINVHTAKNGVVSYWFQIDVGTKPDGTRDRRKFSYPTKAEARKALRRIATEVSSGTYSKPTAITVNEACDDWLAGRRGIRRVTLYSYENDLKPVRRFLGGKRLQQLTKADGDNLVEWMLTEGRTSPRHYRPDSLAGQVAEHPDGIKAAELAAAFPAGDVHSCLAALLAAGRVTRLRRGVYALAEPSIDADADRTRPGGLQPQTVRSALTTFSAVVQSHVNQGVLPRNVIALVERPKDADPDDATTPAEAAGTETTAKSWTLAEVQRFRDAVCDHRLCACWLLSCYGLRRSEVLGLRWSAIDLDAGVLSVRRGRVAVGTKRLRVHRSRSGRGASCRYRPS